MEENKKDINLPKTDFPMRANLTKTELKILDNWKKIDLYQSIRRKKKGKPIFFLHDGPPYANGNIHIGHQVNKILKDIVIKSKSLDGFNSLYTPGWDCHGLPIEHAIERKMGLDRALSSPIEFQKQCREYAEEQIKKQKNDFIRAGILADWDNSYSTMNFQTEANTIRVLGRIIERGYLIRKSVPVHWCTECQSSLAEAEIEYTQKDSLSLYIFFNSVNSNEIYRIFGLSPLKSCISAVVWTTTPWTLPGNCALAVNKRYSYFLIQMDEQRCFIVAKNLFESFMRKTNIKSWKILSECVGKELESILFRHPFMNFSIPIILSDHVTLKQGSGIVHIAPSYGPEDYMACQVYNIKTKSIIYPNGVYRRDVYPDLNNTSIFKSYSLIVKILKKKNMLLSLEKISHSCAHCWRHKIPTIFFSRPQWFINMEHNSLRFRMIKSVESIQWIPRHGKNHIISMILERPNWCISRQRLWGIPIPILFHKTNKTFHPDTNKIIEKVAKEVEKKGIIAWWRFNIKSFLNEEDQKNYIKVDDTLDVWFDSGSTYYSVFSHSIFSNTPVDIFLEGCDQYRGWFMSSLVISTIMENKAPCKTILVHGFVIDEDGKKMSKSLKNVVYPKKIIDKFGSDILRLWISLTNYSSDIFISNEILKRVSDQYRKIRNIVRFLLGNLNDFEIQEKISYKDMIILDRWIIRSTYRFQKDIRRYYENYNFCSVMKCIIEFCSSYMSSFYLEVIKDRQYTNKKNSLARKSCQTALFYILESLVRWISPILSFTADEAWKFLPERKSQSVFLEEYYNLPKDESDKLFENKFWSHIFLIKNEINKVVEQKRKVGLIKNSLESLIILYLDDCLLSSFKKFESELRFLFITSEIKIQPFSCSPYSVKTSGIKGMKISCHKHKGKRCSRCWNHVQIYKKNILGYSSLCTRCVSNTIGNGEKRRFF